MVVLSISLVYLAYAVLIIGAVVGIKRKPEQELNAENSALSFSILIPFRNESSNLSELIKSLEKVNYNKSNFELIFINDHSTDHFENSFSEVEKKFNFKLLHLTDKEGKKNALLKGIEACSNNYVLTIDADCIVPENLLSSYASIITEKDYDLIIGSVVLESSNKFVQQFQSLDFLAMQGVGLGWANHNQAFLCSGANLCYKKSVFDKLQPFNGHQMLASGDDLFTLMKFKEHQMNMGTNLEAVVIASSHSSWKSLFLQRKRWLSKNTFIKDLFFKLVSITVFLTNLSLALLVVLSIFKIAYLEILFIFFTIKFLLDYLLLYRISYQFNVVVCWRSILKISFLYPWLLVVIFLVNFSKSNEWKERKINTIIL